MNQENGQGSSAEESVQQEEMAARHARTPEDFVWNTTVQTGYPLVPAQTVRVFSRTMKKEVSATAAYLSLDKKKCYVRYPDETDEARNMIGKWVDLDQAKPRLRVTAVSLISPGVVASLKYTALAGLGLLMGSMQGDDGKQPEQKDRRGIPTRLSENAMSWEQEIEGVKVRIMKDKDEVRSFSTKLAGDIHQPSLIVTYQAELASADDMDPAVVAKVIQVLKPAIFAALLEREEGRRQEGHTLSTLDMPFKKSTLLVSLQHRYPTERPTISVGSFQEPLFDVKVGNKNVLVSPQERRVETFTRTTAVNVVYPFIVNCDNNEYAWETSDSVSAAIRERVRNFPEFKHATANIMSRSEPSSDPTKRDRMKVMVSFTFPEGLPKELKKN